MFQHVAVCDAFLLISGNGDEEGGQGGKMGKKVAELFDGVYARVAAIIGEDDLIGWHAVLA